VYGISLRWEWNNAKSKTNELKHGLDFETAQLVFDDPLAISRLDLYPDEERWQTIGAIEQLIVIVVHTPSIYDLDSDEEIGRIISARKATRHERRTYEEGNF
jgi:uncharacterized DUF497 family protein